MKFRSPIKSRKSIHKSLLAYFVIVAAQAQLKKKSKPETTLDKAFASFQENQKYIDHLFQLQADIQVKVRNLEEQGEKIKKSTQSLWSG